MAGVWWVVIAAPLASVSARRPLSLPSSLAGGQRSFIFEIEWI